MISVRQCDNVTVVRPETHRLDELMGRQLVSSMREYLGPGSQVVLNLADVVYLNSEAVGYLSACARRLAHHRGGMAVCCLQDGPSGIFRVLRVERILKGIYVTEEEAVEAMASPAPPARH